MSSDGGNGDVADLGGSNRARAARLPRVITALGVVTTYNMAIVGILLSG
jgi:hypothetical protein|eukprot:SAG25_NODE_283_length_10420_cov_9.898382_11_plen_49_part_00